VLSWVRTATALISFGFSIQQFFRVARAGVSESNLGIGPHLFGTIMIVIGLAALLLATLEHRTALAHMATQYPAGEGFMTIPRSRARIVAALIALLGILGLLASVFRD
jgi:putative membrane protein